MYMDSVIAFGLLIILLTSAVVVFVGFYGWKHYQKDLLAHKTPGPENTLAVSKRLEDKNLDH